MSKDQEQQQNGTVATPAPIDGGVATRTVSTSPSPSSPSASALSSPNASFKKGQPIINKMRKYIAENKPFYSFEYFPPKTREGVENLYERLDRMSQLEPLFMDVTWGAGGTTADLTLEISGNAQQMCSGEVMMHLTCTNMPRNLIDRALEQCRELGIRNILALRGDPPHGSESWEKVETGFGYACDLVRYIREKHGDYFGIAVAGYPEGHMSCTSIEDDIAHLKAKVDAGADFIITQLFYDVDLFLEWSKKVRAAGVTVPIIPGIMPIQNYSGFKRMTGFCKTHVPQAILDALEPIQNDDAAVKAYGIELGISMCRKMLAAGTPGVHLYTLNLERSATAILEGLGYVKPRQSGRMPWKESLVTRRQAEHVRPIFWANRPQSYLDRTVHWDTFPDSTWRSFSSHSGAASPGGAGAAAAAAAASASSTRSVEAMQRMERSRAEKDEYANGRWGDRTSPAFGDLSDYHLCNFRTGTKEERRKLWGEAPAKPADIFNVFAAYIEGTVSRLPWCENAIQLETYPIKDTLKRINQAGFLTINSQPRVNGAPSTDPAVGWGGPGGYVYQKAYLEFFASEQHLERLTKLAAEYPSLTYTAVNCKGKTVTNMQMGDYTVNAVTWGVFPNREILQPTIVDVDSFHAWKDEAFALWLSVWRNIYTPGSEAWSCIEAIHDTYFLVNIVDNDYVKGDMFAFFERLLQ